jgi:predicted acyl esterase
MKGTWIGVFASRLLERTTRDIPDAFGRAGIAALRVDDRGIGKSTGDNAKLTSFDQADDVRTVIAWLRARNQASIRSGSYWLATAKED